LGVAGLEKDAPRPGRTPKISKQTVARVVQMTTQEKPPNATHWSTRTMARAAGISRASVGRIWQRHGLKPHRVETFKLSRDPQFAEKLEAIVGLYLNPPEHALVLCCDEKSQIQALDRTQPSLPLKRGRAGTMTHDYKRNGVATLFAALNTFDGTVIGVCKEPTAISSGYGFCATSPPADKQLHLTRQRLDSQAREDPAPAQAPSVLSLRLHADQLLVAQHGGVLLPRADPEPAAAWRLSRYSGTGRCPRGLCDRSRRSRARRDLA
jgi:hypothetical protein